MIPNLSKVVQSVAFHRAVALSLSACFAIQAALSLESRQYMFAVGFVFGVAGAAVEAVIAGKFATVSRVELDRLRTADAIVRAAILRSGGPTGRGSL